MALEDERKLEIVKNAFKRKIMSFSDWEEFKDFLRNLTRARIKTFIINAVQNKKNISDEESELLDSLHSEIDNDL